MLAREKEDQCNTLSNYSFTLEAKVVILYYENKKQTLSLLNSLGTFNFFPDIFTHCLNFS